MKRVTITVERKDGTEKNFYHQLKESFKVGMKYFLPAHAEGLHFPNLEAVKTYFEGQYKSHPGKVTVDIS